MRLHWTISNNGVHRKSLFVFVKKGKKWPELSKEAQYNIKKCLTCPGKRENWGTFDTSSGTCRPDDESIEPSSSSEFALSLPLPSQQTRPTTVTGSCVPQITDTCCTWPAQLITSTSQLHCTFSLFNSMGISGVTRHHVRHSTKQLLPLIASLPSHFYISWLITEFNKKIFITTRLSGFVWQCF